jgi:chitodextrinase
VDHHVTAPQSKKISKTAEDYIEAILVKLSSGDVQFTEKTMNNTYSYTRQVEERNDSRHPPRSHNRRRDGEDEMTAQQRRRYKKITQADLIGKTAGRWTRQEHLRFIQGKLPSSD